MTKNKKEEAEKSHYFTSDHEDAIVKYALTKNSQIRTKLYIDFIEPAFNEMVDKIVYTYRFNSLPNIESLQEECKIWLTTILDKFDVSKGSKAFSYFSVITKNWFIHKTKKSAQRTKREICPEEISKELEQEYLSVNNGYLTKREEIEFWKFLMEEIHLWNDINFKENELKVVKAIGVLFDNIDNIEIFNKKAIYLYIRELTGLNTKQVVNNLNRIREYYKQFKNKWDDGKL